MRLITKNLSIAHSPIGVSIRPLDEDEDTLPVEICVSFVNGTLVATMYIDGVDPAVARLSRTIDHTTYLAG